MNEAEQYKDYADDCLRLAKKADEKDRKVLLHMAEVWKERAAAAAQKPTENA